MKIMIKTDFRLILTLIRMFWNISNFQKYLYGYPSGCFNNLIIYESLVDENSFKYIFDKIKENRDI